MAGLLGGGWTGLAADAFGEAWSQWRAGAAQVIDALEVTSALLLTGSQAYHEQENHTRAAFATMAAS